MGIKKIGLTMLKAVLIHRPAWHSLAESARANGQETHIFLETCEEETMKVRPLHDRLLVKRVAEEETTKGGIIIPDTAKEKPIEGKVVAVGNGKLLEDGKVRALDVKKGDYILFGKYSGTEIKIAGEEHLILREEEVLGIVEKDK
jgi:chaperonin GroES